MSVRDSTTAVVTAMETLTIDAAEALSLSLGDRIAPEDFHVLTSTYVDHRLPGAQFHSVTEHNETDFLITEALRESDQLAFALPRLLEHLLSEYDACVYLGPGVLAVGDPRALVNAAETRGVGLFVPNAPPILSSHQPSVRVLESRAPQVDSRVIALTRGCRDFLTTWKHTTREAVVDIKQRSVHWAGVAHVSTSLGRSDVTVGGSQLMRISDYGSLSNAFVGEWPCIVSCDELFAVVRNAHDAESQELLWQAATAKVDDTVVMDDILSIVQKTAYRFDEDLAPTPFESLRADIRRAIDPFGRHWPAGDHSAFTTWLFEANPQGLTRIADFLIRNDDELLSRFVDARYGSDSFRQYAQSEGLLRWGFDPFTQAFPPVHPERRDDSDEESESRYEPFAWRWNLLKTLVPRYGSRHYDRSQRKLLGSPSPREGKLVPPKARSVNLAPAAWAESPRSLNIVGLFRSESGLGQAARASLRALETLEIPFTHVDTSEMYPSRNQVVPGLSSQTYGQYGDVNLIHANADELLTMNESAFKHRLAGRFNVGVWFWETADLPKRSRGSFALVDELWVASRYLQDVFGQYGRVPVHVIGLAAELPMQREVSRAEMGWPDETLVFLFAYDALSSHGRKNPSATIRAFKQAFGPRYEGVKLVIKASNLGKFVHAKREIETLISDCPAIELIDRYLTRDGVLDLMAASDVYVSLHAAEGYGLTILEAMALGTPAICTGYSGNMDFTTEQNSWLVGFDLVRTDEPTGPYPPGSVWAAPRVDDAVEVMRQIASSRHLINAKSGIARSDALEAASLERYAQRLNEQLRRVL